MKKRAYSLFLHDILDAMSKIERYINKMDKDTFLQNDLVMDGVITNLNVIGEAARNIPEDVRERYPDIPWKRLIGLRNIITHVYFGIDYHIIWMIITENIPGIRPSIERAIKTQEHDEG